MRHVREKTLKFARRKIAGWGYKPYNADVPNVGPGEVLVWFDSEVDALVCVTWKEFHDDGRVYPVEYKHGKKHQWLNDDLQLAAQMLCLAEMLDRPVTMGAIYHIQSRRRREVALTAALTETVRITAAAIQQLLQAAQAPVRLPLREPCVNS